MTKRMTPDGETHEGSDTAPMPGAPTPAPDEAGDTSETLIDEEEPE